MEKKLCICIAGDVVNSRKINSNRLEIILSEIISTINRKYKSTLITPFSIRNGDEIIGLLSCFSDGYKAYLDIYNMLKYHKISMYIGIGFGNLDSRETKDVHRINGSAIRSAIYARDNYLKKNKPYAKQFNHYKKHVQFFVYAEDDIFPYDAINHYIYYIHEKLEVRTQKQNEIIEFIEKNPLMTYKEVGEKFGYTNNAEVNVSKILLRSNFQLIKHAQEELCKLLDFFQNCVKVPGEDVNVD